MSQTDPTGVFEEVSEMDSSSIPRPMVPMIVVSDSPEHDPNVMAASWWMVAGYRPFRFLLAVDQYTHTHEIIETNPEFVLAVPTTEMVDVLTVAGKLSGADVDKFEELGLETVPGQGVDVPLLADAAGNIECSVMESFAFEGTTYYFGSVEHAYVVPGGMDGRIVSPAADVLANLGSDWADEDDDLKTRYYVDVSEDDVASVSGEQILQGLSATLQEKLRE
ncbi:MAG: flavin reductase family protein [Halobacteriales archaeon]